MVNTRRIGGRPGAPDLPVGGGLSRREALQPADLEGAVKATGQIGRIRYGILGALEDDTEFTADDGNVYTQTGRDFGSARILYEDSINATYRSVGFVTTMVNGTQTDAVVNAADFKYLSQSGVWTFEGQYLHSDRDENGEGNGATLDIEYAPRQGSKHTVALTDFDPRL